MKRGFDRVPNGREQVGVPPLPELQPGEERVQRSAAQTHIVMGTRVFGHGDPRRYALVMLSQRVRRRHEFAAVSASA